MFALFTYVYRGPQSYIYLRKQGTHPAGRVANRIICKLGELNRCLQAEAAAGPGVVWYEGGGYKAQRLDSEMHLHRLYTAKTLTSHSSYSFNYCQNINKRKQNEIYCAHLQPL